MVVGKKITFDTLNFTQNTGFISLFDRCGSGTYGSKVLDATDDCCRIHDQCYDRISGGFFGCSPKLVTYDWEGRLNHAVVCTDPLNTCDRNACECDKAAVDCFQRNRATFDIRRKGAGNQYICNP